MRQTGRRIKYQDGDGWLFGVFLPGWETAARVYRYRAITAEHSDWVIFWSACEKIEDAKEDFAQNYEPLGKIIREGASIPLSQLESGVYFQIVHPDYGSKYAFEKTLTGKVRCLAAPLPADISAEALVWQWDKTLEAHSAGDLLKRHLELLSIDFESAYSDKASPPEGAIWIKFDPQSSVEGWHVFTDPKSVEFYSCATRNYSDLWKSWLAWRESLDPLDGEWLQQTLSSIQKELELLPFSR